MNIQYIELGTVRSPMITTICVRVIKSVAADKLGRADRIYYIWLLWIIDEPLLDDLSYRLRPALAGASKKQFEWEHELLQDWTCNTFPVKIEAVFNWNRMLCRTSLISSYYDSLTFGIKLPTMQIQVQLKVNCMLPSVYSLITNCIIEFY